MIIELPDKYQERPAMDGREAEAEMYQMLKDRLHEQVGREHPQYERLLSACMNAMIEADLEHRRGHAPIGISYEVSLDSSLDSLLVIARLRAVPPRIEIYKDYNP